MPNSTVPYIRSMTPAVMRDVEIDTHAIDEYVQTDLRYLELLTKPDRPTLLALVGVQSHQFHRALDLAALARAHGVLSIIGGPHPMTCDTRMLQNRGVSFALSEADLVWRTILEDAIGGELRSVYGDSQRWAGELYSPVLKPPSSRDLRRYVVPMVGLYPARGCPFTCNFCSVIKIAGRQVRSQPVDTTMSSLHAMKAAGIRFAMFTSDNFNKYADAPELLRRMIEEKINVPFLVQCDTQVAKQEEFVELLGRAGCFQMFVGVESFERKTLLAAHKSQNHPELYGDILRLCRRYEVGTHFSNIIGFPQDTVATVREHVDVLRELNPDVASFYILTPIPGTDQYDDFLKEGFITETNLDRFDATTTTWRHPQISAPELEALLFECYRKFFTAGKIMSSTLSTIRPKYLLAGFLPGFGLPLFSRFSAGRRVHPMSGGVGRVRLDAAADYADFRKTRYGIDRAPLPVSLGARD